MRDKFNLKYKKVKVISWKGNSERCLVLRQQCAKTILECMHDGAILVSIDESWLSDMGYTRRKWRGRNDTNGVPIKQLRPKVNLIGAVDSLGCIYNTCT